MDYVVLVLGSDFSKAVGAGDALNLGLAESPLAFKFIGSNHPRSHAQLTTDLHGDGSLVPGHHFHLHRIVKGLANRVCGVLAGRVIESDDRLKLPRLLLVLSSPRHCDTE